MEKISMDFSLKIMTVMSFLSLKRLMIVVIMWSNVHEYVMGSESAGVQFGVSENVLPFLGRPVCEDISEDDSLFVHIEDKPKERYVIDCCVVVLP